MNNTKKFKLIELLVIVLIIGIFSAIALSQYSQAIEKIHATEALRNVIKFRRVVKIWRSAVQNNGRTFTEDGSSNRQVKIDVSDPWLHTTYAMVAALSDPSQKPCSKDFCYKVNYRWVKAYRANSSTYKYKIGYHFSESRYYCIAYTSADLKICNSLSNKIKQRISRF